MDPTILQPLELDKILHELARRTATGGGALRATQLQPSRDITTVRARLAETTQARDCIAASGRPPFGGVTDVLPLLKKTTRGGVLEGKEIFQIGEDLRGTRRLREFLDRTEPGRYHRLQSLAGQIVIHLDLEKEILRCLKETGEVKDEASDPLRDLRREIQSLADLVQSRARTIANDQRYRAMLQEALVTIRNGRYCVPVKQEFKGEFAGVVHDRSGSGATLFVEPMELVGLNNRLRELHIDEQEEIDRILRRLSHDIATFAEEAETSLRAAFELDFIFAKGQLSCDWDGAEPALNAEGRYDFLRARHPLLYEKAVPIDVAVGNDFQALLITGPNTGGKTVALKTVGVLTLMTLCGLHLTAATKSDVAVGGEIYCDIGDEQSIEKNLSTFSAHLSNIIRILHSAGRNSLVLLDEIGTGTDPEEGAALAQAVLTDLVDRGARVIATSHHGALKSFAHLHAKMENASVEFDPQRLVPTFRIRVGHPGRSHALTIARRLGMPDSLLARAESYMSTDRVALDHLLDDLEKQQTALATELAATEREREVLAQTRETLNAERASLQEERVRELARLQAAGNDLLASVRRESEEILRALRIAQRESAATEAQRQRLRDLATHVQELAPEDVTSMVAWDDSLQPGHLVRIRKSNRPGVLLSLPDESNAVWVRMGNVKVEVEAGEIERADQGASSIASEVASQLRLEKALTVPDEIDLHGHRVEEALTKLDKYLDDAILGELESVRIIHGIGTGALRNALHEFLARHPAVAKVEAAPPEEGGAGTTLVTLRS